MKSESEKLTWRKAWKMNLRAWSIWWKLRPSVFLSALASSVMKAVTPYVTIYLSARILDELARRTLHRLRGLHGGLHSAAKSCGVVVQL